MKKLHSIAFYALVTPAIALGSSAAFAQESEKAEQNYLDSAPAGGIQASDLISAEIKTNDDEDVGSVTDLIIDKDGKVAAFVVGVGGFLGMAEKDVAIGWDDVTMSQEGEDSDELELRIDMTRDDLEAAPGYEDLDD